jgi:6-phosphogluconolactonase (cycloisomerase 2 family)
VAAYSVSSDGSFASISGSPFSGSTNYVVLNGASLFGADTEARNIVRYSLNKTTGALTSVGITSAIQPNWADGLVSSLSLDHTGQTLYIGELHGAGDNSYTVFTVGSNSDLTFKADYGPKVTYERPLVFSPDNRFAYAESCWHANWFISGFARAADGSLTEINVRGDPPQGGDFCPLTMAVSAKNYVVVPYAAADRQISLALYQITGDGSLSLLGTTPMPAGATTDGTVRLQFDPTGSFVVVANDAGVQTYRLAGTQLVPTGSTVAANGMKKAVHWDNSNHVFVLADAGLYVYIAKNGILNPAPGSPAAGGDSLAVLPLQ